MSLAQTIAPQLPYLRRYARALTGSQESGDRHVANLLEMLIEDPARATIGESVREDLFRVFTQIWESIDPLIYEGTQSADKKVLKLTPRARQAFLLTTVEGFSKEQAAGILSVEEAELSQLIETAGREIAEQVATDVLIIEDEPLIAIDIEQMVTELGHSVTGIARTHDEAIEQVSRQKPGLVLADIQLADGSSGVEAVNEILQKINVPVIFITAFPERLLTGERPEPAFLVTKPFHPDMLRALISQALFFETNAGKDA